VGLGEEAVEVGGDVGRLLDVGPVAGLGHRYRCHGGEAGRDRVVGHVLGDEPVVLPAEDEHRAGVAARPFALGVAGVPTVGEGADDLRTQMPPGRHQPVELGLRERGGQLFAYAPLPVRVAAQRAELFDHLVGQVYAREGDRTREAMVGAAKVAAP
jgi:hypothetical protein